MVFTMFRLEIPCGIVDAYTDTVVEGDDSRNCMKPESLASMRAITSFPCQAFILPSAIISFITITIFHFQTPSTLFQYVIYPSEAVRGPCGAPTNLEIITNSPPLPQLPPQIAVIPPLA